MAYVSPTNKTTGTLITATIWNQDVVANSQAAAPDAFLLNGDLFVGTAADAGVRLNAGNGGEILRTNWGGTPSLDWAPFIDSVQAGTAAGTVGGNGWYCPGNINLATAGVVDNISGHLQVGCYNVSILDGQTVGSVNVTFPVAFATAPLVFATPAQAVMMAAFPIGSTSLTQAAFVATRTGSSGSINVVFAWMAVGAFGYDGTITPRP